MANKNYVIGVDFGSDSVRALVVDCANGEEVAQSVSYYRHWKQGDYCSPKENRYRQHPQDYIDSLVEITNNAVAQCPQQVRDNIVGISFDTTASTPALTNREGTPLALTEEFANEPDAMFVLWKDHTAIAEADEINALSHSYHIDYTLFSGGTYSCEWGWAKVLHILRTNPAVAEAAYCWVEHCDWISALLTGDTTPEKIARSRCVAGHKALWNESWGGLPEEEFFAALHPQLAQMASKFDKQTYTADYRVGNLTPEWAARLGLPEGIAVGLGAIDCHVGAVGAGIADNMQVKVMGTSTCDIIVSPYESVGDKAVRGICGQVDGSVLPGKIGFEAGQAAFGDVYAWFKRLLAWPISHFELGAEVEDKIIAALTEEASRLPLTTEDPVAVDWFNGRRTPDAEPLAKGSMAGLTMATTAPEIFKALVEATAFGSRAINERMSEEGVRIDEIIAVGGISKKSSFVMQTMADVIGVNIKVVRSEQACALGAAMFASVVAGVHPDIVAAQRAMSSGYDAEYTPSESRHNIYNTLYQKYLHLGRK